jgi:deoxyribonuclease IV
VKNQSANIGFSTALDRACGIVVSHRIRFRSVAMPLFGAHLSVSGGYDRAIASAVELGLDTVQIFTGSPQNWSVRADAKGHWIGRDLNAEAVRSFRAAARAAKLKHLTAHDSYLINLAAPDETLYRKSIAAFLHEIDAADALGLSYLVTHPGAHIDSGEAVGLAKVAAAFREIFAARPESKAMVLLETTAGQGSSLGWKFEHLAHLLDAIGEPNRLGVCFDTCHVFAAGYPLAKPCESQATFAEFDRVVGLKQIRFFHVNDSLKPLASRVDRHAGIGLGEIGEDFFRRLVTDRRFAKLPMVLETPKHDADKTEMDPVNLAKLRSFLVREAA